MGSEPLINKPEEVELGLCMEVKPRFIKKDDYTILSFLESGKSSKEGKKPTEPGRPLREVVGVAVPPILDSDVEVPSDGGLPLRGWHRLFINVDQDIEVFALSPVFRDFSG